MKQRMHRTVAAEDMFRRRKIVSPTGVFDECELITLSREFMGCDQARERRAEDDGGFCGTGGHEKRERIQIPAAIARR